MLASSAGDENLDRGVAQLVAHTVWDREVAGSSPVAPTIDKTLIKFNNIIAYGYGFVVIF